MYFKQYYLGCLAHASYLIGSNGEAAVVDPQRDVDQYIEEARAQGLAIKHVIETHLHADFVSGHRELAERTGAAIYVGHRGGATFPHVPVKEGMEIPLGDVVLRFLETPGHTPESVSILVFDRSRSEQPLKVLTGDTLFIGDVGRPDLVSAKGHTAEDMAAMMYSSLRDKLLALPDSVEVFPAHGAGSACGRFMSEKRSSTLGEQRQTNWALQPMSREEFIQRMTQGLPPAPRYFAFDAELNRRGAPGAQELAPAEPLRPDAFAQRAQAGALVLDVREAPVFARGHVPGALHIGLSGQFAPWCGTILPAGKPILLVAEDLERIHEATVRLARVGYDSVAGFLEGGMDAWVHSGRAVETVGEISVEELRDRLARGADLQVIDVRRPAEHEVGHVPRALNVPLDQLEGALDRVDRGRTAYVICASGYRSSIACSLLQRAGVKDVVNVLGGHGAWQQAGFAMEQVPAPAANEARV